MILFGSLVQVKGFGFALVWSRKRWMASLSSRSDRNTLCLRRFFVSLAKKPSIALSQEADVGVKWKTNRRCFSSYAMTSFVDGVVGDEDMDRLFPGHSGLDHV